ncbi:hypothetical protein KC19_2G216200 [Ceratodon purpureus]|uniref:Uncharacterized protein n=1 Tax=Ceratodon purpureus TaxID=3225 RepID=A0A8T0IXY8_CERPU|nr:hypothetical protein KC19_2G216200 [Ceratodon purpureus]
MRSPRYFASCGAEFTLRRRSQRQVQRVTLAIILDWYAWVGSRSSFTFLAFRQRLATVCMSPSSRPMVSTAVMSVVVGHPAAAMACLHGQHSCERFQPGGSLKLGRREFLGERNFLHARTRVKGRRGGSRIQVRAGLEELSSNQRQQVLSASSLNLLRQPWPVRVSTGSWW